MKSQNLIYELNVYIIEYMHIHLQLYQTCKNHLYNDTTNKFNDVLRM